MAYKSEGWNGMVWAGAATILVMIVLFYMLFGYMKKAEQCRSARPTNTSPQ